MFLLRSVPNIHQLSYATVVFIGVLLLIILVDEYKSIDKYLYQIEWATLVFLAAWFLLMQCLAQLGLVAFLGDHFKQLISLSATKTRLAMTVLIFIWVSIKRI